MSRQRNIRKKAASEEPEEEVKGGEPECQRDRLEETKLMQSLRRRTGGTGAGALAMGLGGPAAAAGEGAGAGPGGRGRSATPEPEPGVVMDAYVKAKSAATTQDEDAHMQKYIEEQLALRLGKSAAARAEEDEQDPEAKRRKVEAELYAVPADLRTGLEQDVVLPGMGMATALAEVPLGAADKLAGIEATEALKRRLLARVGQGTISLEEEEEARRREAERIRRGMFVKQFGRSKERVHKEPEELERERRERRVVKERGGGSKR